MRSFLNFPVLLLLYMIYSAHLQNNQNIPNNPTNSSYSQTDAKQYLHASAVSYCPQDQIQSWTCKPCKKLPGYKLYDLIIGLTTDGIETNTIIIINQSKQRIIVASQGTQGTSQLISQITSSYGTDYTIHSIDGAVAMYYFYQSYLKSMRSQLQKNYMTLKEEYSNYTMIITGHSLGGAFAEHAALDAIKSGWVTWVKDSKPWLYTFGEPRIGNYPLAMAVMKELDGRFFRVTHWKDIVPHIPPCAPSFGSGCLKGTDQNIKSTGFLYYPFHAGKEEFYTEDSSSHSECKELEDESCSNQFYLHLSVDDHLSYLGESATCG